MEMKSDSNDSDDDEKYHIRSVGSGQISHLVNNGSYDAGMDTDINDLVNNDLKAESSGLSEDRNSIYVDDLKQSDNHVPFPIPPTENKKYPQRKCVSCRRGGVRRDTRYYCDDCIGRPALCRDCFREYHL